MASRLFIIEGPDCSGKTTLARHMAVQLGGTYLHASGHPALHAGMVEYHESILSAIEWNMAHDRGGHVFILDRFWPSEFVYGREFRTHLVDRYPFKEVQDRISKLGGKYVFCMDGHVGSRHAREHVPKNHVPYDGGQFSGVIIGYQALMSIMGTRPDYIHYDMTRDGADLVGFTRRAWEL